MTAPTLAQIRRIHEAQHGGYIGDCTCRVDGKLCQVVYREAVAREDERAQRLAAVNRQRAQEG